MALYKRGEVSHYDFAMDGKRYRGSTKEAVSSKARMIEARLMNEAKQRKLTVQRRTLTLAEFSKRFLEWVEETRLEPESKGYYRSGWRMLAKSPISACGSHTSPPTRQRRFGLIIRQRMRTGLSARCEGCWARRRSGA